MSITKPIPSMKEITIDDLSLILEGVIVRDKLEDALERQICLKREIEILRTKRDIINNMLIRPAERAK